MRLLNREVLLSRFDPLVPEHSRGLQTDPVHALFEIFELTLEQLESVIDLRFLFARELRQEAMGSGYQRAEDTFVER